MTEIQNLEKSDVVDLVATRRKTLQEGEEGEVQKQETLKRIPNDIQELVERASDIALLIEEVDEAFGESKTEISYLEDLSNSGNFDSIKYLISEAFSDVDISDLHQEDGQNIQGTLIMLNQLGIVDIQSVETDTPSETGKKKVLFSILKNYGGVLTYEIQNYIGEEPFVEDFKILGLGRIYGIVGNDKRSSATRVEKVVSAAKEQSRKMILLLDNKDDSEHDSSSVVIVRSAEVNEDGIIMNLLETEKKLRSIRTLDLGRGITNTLMRNGIVRVDELYHMRTGVLLDLKGVEEELLRLDGIGPIKASKIIEAMKNLSEN